MYDFRMRLALSVNDQKIARASLEGKGFLSAHLNLSGGSVGEGGSDLSLVAYGESDPPSEVIRSTESSLNLFSDLEQARLLLSAVKACDAALMSVVQSAQAAEPSAEFEKIRLAVSAVIAEMDSRLISPTLRSHPSLLGLAQKLGLY